MAATPEDNKFDWNDVVKVKDEAPELFRSGEITAVCGMEKVAFADLAEKYRVRAQVLIMRMFTHSVPATEPLLIYEKLKKR